MKKTTRLLITSLQWGHVITDLNRGLQLCLHVSGVFPEVSFQKNTAKENNTHIMGKVGPRWGNARHGTVLSAQGVQYDLLIIEALLLLGCHTSGDRENVSDCFRISGFPMCCLLLATLWIIRCHGRDVLHKDPKALGPKQVWLGGLDGLDTLGWGKSASTISDENLPSTF